MQNRYPSRINWQNEPSVQTPINESNLNRMDNALFQMAADIISVSNNTFVGFNYEETTGKFIFIKGNGQTYELDTALEKVALNYDYDPDKRQLILILADGTTQRIDISSVVTNIILVDSDTITWQTVSGKTKAEIINGSITAEKLQPNFLADCTDAASRAVTSATNAKESEDRAKEYADKAEAIVDIDIATTEKAGISKPDGTTVTIDEDGTLHAQSGISEVNWDDVKQKPTEFTPSAHKHTKSEITDFPTSLPASDVYEWAKASTKPSYTASEVGARPSTWTPSKSDVGLGNVDNTADSNKTVNKAGYASSNTVATTSATANLKNIYAGTADVGSTLPTGVIYIQYE